MQVVFVVSRDAGSITDNSDNPILCCSFRADVNSDGAGDAKADLQVTCDVWFANAQPTGGRGVHTMRQERTSGGFLIDLQPSLALVIREFGGAVAIVQTQIERVSVAIKQAEGIGA